jgi:signal transduction histidine kinase
MSSATTSTGPEPLPDPADDSATGVAPEAGKRRIGIASMLFWCFLSVALVTLAATVVALVLFHGVRQNMTEITDRTLRQMSNSFSLADETTALLAGTRLLPEASDRESLAQQLDEIKTHLRTIETLAAEHRRQAGASGGNLNLFIGDLRDNIDGLAAAVDGKLKAHQRRTQLIVALNHSHDAFIGAIGPVIKAERDAMLASTRQIVRDGTAQIGTLIDGSFEALRAVLQMEANTNYIASVLYQAASDDDYNVLMRRRFALVAPVATIKGAANQVEDVAGGGKLTELAAEIYRAAFWPGNVFTLRAKVLSAAEADRPAAARRLNREIARIVSLQAQFRDRAAQLLNRVDGEILAANRDAAEEGQQILHRTRADLARFETVTFINSDTNLYFGLLSLAGTVTQSDQLDALQAQEVRLRQGITKNLAAFEGAPGHAKVAKLVAGTLGFGTGDSSIFAARRAELDAARHADQLSHETEELTSLLVITARALSSDAAAASAKAVERTRASLTRGEIILIALAGSSFLLVAFIAWFYVYRAIVRRLRGISRVMLEIAEGDLEAAIPAAARNDEIADMTGALRVFQANAIRRRRAEAALKVAKDEAERALAELKAAQTRLIHAEKMASLGHLTAGIAHEIKNPLNFINNFSALSAEMLGELAEVVQPALKDLPDEDREDADDLIETVVGNLDKISHHGKRADSIVRNMLMHSRSGPSEAATASINALADEALNLAYHGARAEDSNFNIDIRRDFDPEAGEIECFPQEIERVILNLVSNGMYAATQRAATAGGQPMIEVTTLGHSGGIEVRVRDNGAGIEREARARIFEPFFTTKPANEGTGLGLSLSHNVVVDQHHGTIDVESVPGDFTCFTVTLNRKLS